MSTVTEYHTRLAPTPSGLLHPGNGVSFILTWALARKEGLKILLRIDDLDRTRRRTEYLGDIFKTIDWLGIDYDEGPTSVADFLQHYSQHLRLDLYHEMLEQLRAKEMLYGCTCSRKAIAQASENGLYPHTCRPFKRPLDKPDTAWRLRLADHEPMLARSFRQADQLIDPGQLLGDFVVRQKDGLPAYQIASLADDLHFGVTHIVRGQDLLPSTGAQLLLAQRLGREAFQEVRFFHHGLLLDEKGQKLSKSQGAGSLAAWREAGRSPGELFEGAARLLGLNTIPHSATELLELLR